MNPRFLLDRQTYCHYTTGPSGPEGAAPSFLALETRLDAGPRTYLIGGPNGIRTRLSTLRQSRVPAITIGPNGGGRESRTPTCCVQSSRAPVITIPPQPRPIEINKTRLWPKPSSIEEVTQSLTARPDTNSMVDLKGFEPSSQHCQRCILPLNYRPTCFTNTAKPRCLARSSIFLVPLLLQSHTATNASAYAAI